MIQVLLIGLGSGAVSALLFASLASGKTLAVLLFYLTPLPIFLAGIAWSHVAGLIAALIAAAALGLTLGSWFVVAFLISIGFPSYVLSYLALLARPTTNGGGERLEWFPPGRLVIAAALLAAFATTLSVPAFGWDLETYRATLKATFERVLRANSDIPPNAPLKLPGLADTEALLDNLVVAMPLAAAALAMITNLANLWLAGRIANAGRRLKRPWPDIASLTFPQMTPVALFVVIGLSFLPNLIGLVASIFAATLIFAYTILGLCILHASTRTLAMRAPMLAGVWALVLIFIWPSLVLAILGLADSFVDFRGRAARRGPPNLPTNPRNE
jgi:hypothetical protein